MKYLKLLSATLCLFAFITTADAQFTVNRDFRPVAPVDYAELKGTPYLYEDWQMGSVKLTSGVSNTEKMVLKYNLLNDVLSFKDKASGEEMGFVVPVQEFTIEDATGNALRVRRFRSGYSGITGTTPNSFFEVLSDGKVQLLKKQSKTITESMHIGDSGMTRSFTDRTKYYLVIAGKAHAVKNDQNAILDALGDKLVQLDKFITDNNLNLKKDAELGKLIDYYNTL